MYGDSSSSTCKLCQKNCAVCNDPNSCINCTLGFFLLNSNCISDCGSYMYGDMLSGLCASCAKNCINCIGPRSNQCTTCKNAFYLYQNTCYQNCPNGTGSNDKGCELCPITCSTCAFPLQGFCTSCILGYTLNQGYCDFECIDGYYYNKSLMKCLKCDYRCLTCNIINGSFCLSCQPEYLFSNGSCDYFCARGYFYPHQGATECLIAGPIYNSYLNLLIEYLSLSILLVDLIIIFYGIFEFDKPYALLSFLSLEMINILGYIQIDFPGNLIELFEKINPYTTKYFDPMPNYLLLINQLLPKSPYPEVVPGNFKYSYHNSFIQNCGHKISMLLLFFASGLIVRLYTKFVGNPSKFIIKIDQMLLYNLPLTYICINTFRIGFAIMIKILTMNNSIHDTYDQAIAGLFIMPFFGIPLIFIYLICQAFNKDSESVEKIEIHWSSRFGVVLNEFESTELYQLFTLPLLLLRIIITIVIMTLINSSPLAITIWLCGMSLITIAYYIIVRPFRSLAIMVIYTAIEIMIFIANVLTLILVYLDIEYQESTNKIIYGWMIIALYLMIVLANISTLPFVVYWIHQKTEKKMISPENMKHQKDSILAKDILLSYDQIADSRYSFSDKKSEKMNKLSIELKSMRELKPITEIIIEEQTQIPTEDFEIDPKKDFFSKENYLR